TTLEEIAKAVHKCAYGIKAILIVFEANRFTEEQKRVLNQIRTFLGRDATNHIIASDWSVPVRSFIQNIGNRWSISPNHQVHKNRLREIKELIKCIPEIYKTEQFEKNLREQEEAKQKDHRHQDGRNAYSYGRNDYSWSSNKK
ncbi:3978_t:CDS:2, partial [Cetraspora pellucida]